MKMHIKNFLLLFCLLNISALAFNEANAANGPKIKDIRIFEGNTDSTYKIVVIVKNDDKKEVDKIVMEIEPADSTSPELEKARYIFTEDPNLSTGNERYFRVSGDPVKILILKEHGVGTASTIQGKYNVNTTMLDSKNNTIGNAVKETVTVSTKDEKCPYDYDMEEIGITAKGSNVVIDGGDLVFTNQAELTFSLALTNNTSKVNAQKCELEFSGVDCSGECTLNCTLTYNEKTDKYEGSLKIDASEKCTKTFSQIIISAQNPCNDYKFYQVNFNKCTGFGNGYTYFDLKKYNPEKENNSSTSANDSCKTKYKLSSVSTTTSNTSGLYTMAFQFAFDKGSDVPEKVVMVVQIKDCNGNTKNISIELKYNAKTGEYIGGQAIKQDSKCEWEIVDAEIGAYNICNELSAWSLNISQYKSNGKGTRQVATTTNGKPGLL